MYHSIEPLNPPPANDAIPLTPLLSRIHQQYFEGKLLPCIDWGIPPAVQVTKRIKTSFRILNNEETTSISTAQALAQSDRFQEAIHLLRPLADEGHPEAEHLLILVLKRVQGNWEHYASRKAERSKALQLVSASHFDCSSNSIILHHYLACRKAPRFVLSYLIFHECLRAQEALLNQEKPTCAFLRAERNAPHRDKAHQWLKRHGFPIFELKESAPSTKPAKPASTQARRRKQSS